jgi:predicted transcriptional regulator YdeE
MEPKIVQRDAFTVIGIITPFEPGKPDFFNDMWLNRFPPREDEVKPLSRDKAYYGVYYHDQADPLKMEYLAGMAVENASEVPEGLVARQVPAARYVVCECRVGNIPEASDYLFGQWLPASPYEYDSPGCDFEYYPPSTETGEDPVLLYIPIREKRAA